MTLQIAHNHTNHENYKSTLTKILITFFPSNSHSLVIQTKCLAFSLPAKRILNLDRQNKIAHTHI